MVVWSSGVGDRSHSGRDPGFRRRRHARGRAGGLAAVTHPSRAGWRGLPAWGLASVPAAASPGHRHAGLHRVGSHRPTVACNGREGTRDPRQPGAVLQRSSRAAVMTFSPHNRPETAWHPRGRGSIQLFSQTPLISVHKVHYAIGRGGTSLPPKHGGVDEQCRTNSGYDRVAAPYALLVSSGLSLIPGLRLSRRLNIPPASADLRLGITGPAGFRRLCGLADETRDCCTPRAMHKVTRAATVPVLHSQTAPPGRSGFLSIPDLAAIDHYLRAASSTLHRMSRPAIKPLLVRSIAAWSRGPARRTVPLPRVPSP
jgi:hypothetical protein